MAGGGGVSKGCGLYVQKERGGEGRRNNVTTHAHSPENGVDSPGKSSLELDFERWRPPGGLLR